MPKKIPEFEYPPLERRGPDDHSSAVSAFHRLYKYALKSGRLAFCIFAAYKALQKLEEIHQWHGSEDGDPGIPRPSIVVPSWVQDGLWLAFESYLMNEKLPGTTAKGRRIAFRAALASEWRKYERWFKVYSTMIEKSLPSADKAAESLHGQGYGAKRTLQSAFADLEKMLSQANSEEFLDDDGSALAFIEPRDLVPTQRLLSIFGAHDLKRRGS